MTLGKTYKYIVKTRIMNTIDSLLEHKIEEVTSIKARGRRSLGKSNTKTVNGIKYTYAAPSEEITVKRNDLTNLRWLLEQYKNYKGEKEIPRGVQGFGMNLNGIPWVFKKTTKHSKDSRLIVEHRDGVRWDDENVTKNTLKEWSKELREIGILNDICEVGYIIKDRSVCPTDICGKDGLEIIRCEDI